MCGIAGFTHSGQAAAQGVMQRITESLSHRGPDQRGIYEADQVSLGAVRLKIIDLTGGDQPIVSDDGDTVIVFNGEVYNHLELRRELESLGHSFRSHCDTEVALQAFQEWDTDCFSRMRGMFAVALWSKSRRRLVLARDRMGIKPLYVCRQGRDLYFGSELKAILGHPQVPRRLDLAALNDYLSLNYVPAPRTLVSGIEKLAPGHFLEWHDGDVRTSPWWRLEFHPQPEWTLESAKEELDRLLREAVREQLVSDVPLGIWLSGGVDSSTVLHYAAQFSPSRLKTFSVSYQGRSFDESPYFREAARIYGTEHHEFDLNPEVELRTAVEEMAYYSDEPGADAGALPVWFLSRMSRSHVTVALSGEGADELFGGYLTYLADRWACALRSTPSPLRRLALQALNRCLPVSDEKVISFEYKLKRLVEGSLLSPDEAHLFWNGVCSNAQKRELCPHSNAQSLGALYEGLPAHNSIGYLNRYLLLDQQYYLADDILYKVDRMSMAHALEVRPPFLDHRIVEFAASLPQNLKVRGWTTKYLLRQMMKDKLPDSVLRRKKMGFDIPAHDWFRGTLRGVLLDIVTAETVKNAEIFDFRAIQRLIRNHLERRVNVGYQLWGLLTLFLWMKRWKIEASPQANTRTTDPVQMLVTS